MAAALGGVPREKICIARGIDAGKEGGSRLPRARVRLRNPRARRRHVPIVADRPVDE